MRFGSLNSNYKHGLGDHLLYDVHRQMMQRCYNNTHPNFKRYGKRGIKVCKAWHKLKPFYEWAINNGYQEGLQIDRVDVNGNYEPANCRFISHKDNQRNKRNNLYVTYNNKTLTLVAWCEVLNLNYKRVKNRLARGWSVEKALSTATKTGFQDYYWKSSNRSIS